MKPIAWALIFSLTGCHGQIHPIPSPNRGFGSGSFVKKNDQTSPTNGRFPPVSPTNPMSTAAFSNPLTNPSIIVVSVSNYGHAGTPTPTDTAGNTYLDSGAGQVNANTNNASCQMFYALNTHTTANNVISVANPSLYSIVVTAVEFTGGAASSPVRAFAKNANATAGAFTHTSTNIAGTVAKDLIVGLEVDPDTNVTAVGAGYTVASYAGFDTEYNLSGAGGSVAATWTSSSSGDIYGAIAVAFKLGP